MTAMSDVLENGVLDLILRSVPLSTPGITTGDVYTALFTLPTTDTMTGPFPGEVTGGGYVRVGLGSNFSVAVSGSATNSATATFPLATAAWGTITHFALMDALAGGNPLFHGPLTTPKVVNAGDSFVFPVGNITISID